MSTHVELRELVSGDASIFASWQTDPRFTAHAGWRPATSIADSERWWRERISDPDPLLLRLLVVEADTPVGYVDLYGADQHERELGYLIGPSSRWGRGLATAAARAALTYGFQRLHLRRIWAEAVAANGASVRVLEKVGLRPIGRGDDQQFLDEDSHYERYELRRSEWSNDT